MEPTVAVSPGDRVRRGAGVEARTIRTGTLLVNMQSGRAFKVNHVGATVWDLVAASPTCGSLFGQIADRYRIPLARAEAEVGTLLQQLLNERLIEIDSLAT